MKKFVAMLVLVFLFVFAFITPAQAEAESQSDTPHISIEDMQDAIVEEILDYLEEDELNDIDLRKYALYLKAYYVLEEIQTRRPYYDSMANIVDDTWDEYRNDGDMLKMFLDMMGDDFANAD